MTIRGIQARIPTSAKDITKRVRAAIEDCAGEMESELQKVVATSEWMHVERIDRPSGITVQMAGKTAEWLVRGTKPRVLPLKPDGFYVFPKSRKRKTTPGQFTSRPEVVSSELIYAKGPIRLPGTEAGQWPGIMVRRLRPKLQRNLRSAIRG